MPLLSSFFGIVIYMYWEKKAKHSSPHFHAIYNEYECVYRLPDLNILAGALPKRADRLVKIWAKLHLDELIDNWKRVKQDMHPTTIEPLD